jgi:hypothetical protein
MLYCKVTKKNAITQVFYFFYSVSAETSAIAPNRYCLLHNPAKIQNFVDKNKKNACFFSENIVILQYSIDFTMQGQKEFSQKLYYNINLNEMVPKDDVYRKINQTIDFSFLKKATLQYYGKTRNLNYSGQLAVDTSHHVITAATADFCG